LGSPFFASEIDPNWRVIGCLLPTRWNLINLDSLEPFCEFRAKEQTVDASNAPWVNFSSGAFNSRSKQCPVLLLEVNVTGSASAR
jgi:hypothetical protein